jgi:hypothetical protein
MLDQLLTKKKDFQSKNSKDWDPLIQTTNSKSGHWKFMIFFSVSTMTKKMQTRNNFFLKRKINKQMMIFKKPYAGFCLEYLSLDIWKSPKSPKILSKYKSVSILSVLFRITKQGQKLWQSICMEVSLTLKK